MQPKSERFEMRLDQTTLDRLDQWRGRQSDLPSRSEAARRLIEKGFEAESAPATKLTPGERLIIAMISDLYRQNLISREIDPEFVMSAITGGHYWALGWELQVILHEHEDSPVIVSEVVNVLDMWSFIEGSFKKMPKPEKEKIKGEIGLNNVEFIGFDGNNESEHLGVARFLIEKMGRFAEFKGRDLNSHMPRVAVYRRMLQVFDPMRAQLIGIDLTGEQIVKILKAGRRE
ncbi:YfbU family protein [Tistlia consotensis]|uniref:YfbU family protein n=1 Tax=Tistlia consotensis TaxID=1321365 RepID=UPI000A156587|nr:YfbU family protein [Tistlia consotensis]